MREGVRFDTGGGDEKGKRKKHIAFRETCGGDVESGCEGGGCGFLSSKG